MPNLHGATVYALLSEFPSAEAVANAHLTRLTNLISASSNGHHGKEKAEQIRNASRNSIGYRIPAKSLELKHTIKLISELTSEINEIEIEIQRIMNDMNSRSTNWRKHKNFYLQSWGMDLLKNIF